MSMSAERINALTIAGTDPSGGAGIQADLKAFSALGAYGTSVITALVAQNTRGVQSVYPIDAGFVQEQLDSVLSDVRIDSAKIGMLSSADIVTCVADALKRYPLPYVVLDTVMVAKSGDALLAPQAVSAIREQLLPQVSLITPNLPEAATLLGCAAAEDGGDGCPGRSAAGAGMSGGSDEGGHLRCGESPDWLLTRDGAAERFSAARVATRHTHGTGCTLSAALAALRPRHEDWRATVAAAKVYLQGR